MSLILGIFSKNKKIDQNYFQNVIDEFSLNNARKIKIEKSNNIIFASAQLFKNSQGNIVLNNDKSITCLFSGEIYNKKINYENTNGSAEIILKNYEEKNISFLKKLNGIFTFAVFDKKTNKLILTNDQFGIYPLYIYNDKDVCIFSNEYQPILKYSKFKKILNYNAIAEYFILGLSLNDKTFFKNITNMPPATIFEITNENENQYQYKNFDIKVIRDKPIEYFSKKISKITKKSIKSRLYNPEDIICSLTGGVDTRLNLSCMSDEQRQKTSFLTCKAIHLTDDEDQDVLIAKKITKKLNLNHKIVTHTMLKNKFSKNYFQNLRPVFKDKKTLGGIYGGEFLGGCYLFLLRDLNQRETQYLKIKNIFSESFLEKIVNPYDSLRNYFRKIKCENKELFFKIIHMCRGFFTNIYQGSRANWLIPNIFPTKERSIFWNSDLLTFLLKVPDKFLKDYTLYNNIFQNHFQELTSIPSNSPLTKHENRCIKKIEIGKEPKEARKPLYTDALLKYINEKKTWKKDFYNNKYFESISKNENHNDIIKFIDFEAWYRAYID